jgi:hypothetical protein
MALDPTIAGVLAACWLLGLWIAASLLRGQEQPSNSTLRDALLLGALLPAVLAVAGILTFWTAWCALVATLAYALWRRRSRMLRLLGLQSSLTLGGMIVVVAVFAIAWPAVVRPLLQGDSLSYHLPNAASWVATHSLWQSGTRYWWFPGGSELFAAGVFTVAGPTCVGLAGFVAVLLLGMRLRSFAVAVGWSDLTAGLAAAAIATIPAIALQAGSLENDVWLAAFCVEALWCARYEQASLTRTVGLTTLIKPYGFLFAAIVLVVQRISLRTALVAFTPIALWLVRDAILMPSAMIPFSRNASTGFATTIVGNGTLGFATLAHAALAAGPGFVLASFLWVASIAFSRDLPLRICAIGCAFFFFFEPFGFKNDIPQLATGASLRYALPALAIGSVGAFAVLRRVEIVCGFASGVLALSQIRTVDAIFFNDATTHGVAIVGVMLAVALALGRTVPKSFAVLFAGLALVTYASRLAGTHPLDYLSDALSAGRGTRVFSWLAATKPKRVVGVHVSIGMISLASPSTVAYDSDDRDPCRQARAAGALLMTPHDSGCGRIVYADPFATVSRP